MRHFRLTLVPILVSTLIAGGCQTTPVTVTEYRPTHPVVVERNAPASEVFELVRWQPVAAATSTAIHPAKPDRQIPVELQRRYLDRGQPLGFARSNGQLIAIAGDTTMPLVDAHYEWKTAPGQPMQADGSAYAGLQQTSEAAAVVLLVATIGGLIFWGLHDNRHRLDHVFLDSD